MARYLEKRKKEQVTPADEGSAQSTEQPATTTNMAVDGAGETLLNEHICRDNMRGVCKFGSHCRFVHLPQPSVSARTLLFCRDLHLYGRCDRERCKYVEFVFVRLLSLRTN